MPDAARRAVRSFGRADRRGAAPLLAAVRLQAAATAAHRVGQRGRLGGRLERGLRVARVEAAATALAETTAIPEGGGTIFGDQGVVVTQPKPGDFKGFTNICTHMECPLTT